MCFYPGAVPADLDDQKHGTRDAVPSWSMQLPAAKVLRTPAPIRRCEACDFHKTPCPSPPPDTSIPWGHAEFIQLGDYWIHVSVINPSRPSYGSALSAYEAALTKATTDAETRMARHGYLAAWRCCLAQTEEGQKHAYAAPIRDCNCPVCLDATSKRPA